MDPHQTLEEIRSSDRQIQGDAYQAMITATDQPVDWAYDVWDEVVADLSHDNNRVRSIASQVLCNLAKSDPKERIVDDLPRLVEVTKDERFVTARHCLQSLWKVGVVGERQRDAYRRAMADRFADCRSEKNWSLIRSDIAESLRRVYDETGDERIRETAQHLIDTEDDDKYRKKYAKAWKL
jgi:hypothetical protein